jgi:hypothetical protein
MAEQRGERGDRPPHEALDQERARRVHQLRFPRAVAHEAVDAPLAGHVPAVDPVAPVQRAVGAELDVDRQCVAQELLDRAEREARAARLEHEGLDPAALRRPAEVDQEEVARERAAEARPGLECEPRRTVGQVGDGRHEVGGLAVEVRLPQAFVVPGTAHPRSAQVLVGLAPAALAALDHVHDARAVAAVGVVVAREEIEAIVEGELLRIAQPGVPDLELAAVQVAAQHRAGVRMCERPGLRLDVEPAVADREVEPPVRAQRQPVQVVPEEGHVHTVARREDRAFLGVAVVVGVAEAVQAGDVRPPQLAAALEQPGRDAVGRIAEAVGEDQRPIGDAVAVQVLEAPDALLLHAVVGEALALAPAHHLDPVGDGAAGQVVVQPVHVLADVGDAGVQAEGLADVDAPARIQRDRHGIGDQRLGRHELDVESFGNAEGGERLPRLVGGELDARIGPASTLDLGLVLEARERDRDDELCDHGRERIAARTAQRGRAASPSRTRSSSAFVCATPSSSENPSPSYSMPT